MTKHWTWEEAFFSKVLKTDSCWLWLASKQWDGYGRFTRDSVAYPAHRFIYKKLVGDLIDGLVIDHVCKNRACVNPKHLRQVTIRENNVTYSNSPPAKNATKTHCIRGHKYTPKNTYKQRGINRLCRKCMKINKANWKLKQKTKNET